MQITICDNCRCSISDKDEVWKITVVNNEGLSFTGGEPHKAKQKIKKSLIFLERKLMNKRQLLLVFMGKNITIK